MPDFDVADLEITPDDFIDECNQYEINELIKRLRDDGYIPPIDIEPSEKRGALDYLFNDAIIKISQSKHRLTIEEENIIMNIANRL
jgi:hypothetical protein